MSNLIKEHKMLRILNDVDLTKYLKNGNLDFFGIIAELEPDKVEQIPLVWYGEGDYCLADCVNAFNDFFLSFFSKIGQKPTIQPIPQGKKHK